MKSVICALLLTISAPTFAAEDLTVDQFFEIMQVANQSIDPCYGSILTMTTTASEPEIVNAVKGMDQYCPNILKASYIIDRHPNLHRELLLHSSNGEGAINDIIAAGKIVRKFLYVRGDDGFHDLKGALEMYK